MNFQKEARYRCGSLSHLEEGSARHTISGRPEAIAKVVVALSSPTVLPSIEAHSPIKQPNDDDVVMVADPESTTEGPMVSQVPPMPEPEPVNIEPAISQVPSTPEWMVVPADQSST